jgi:hypothetical protein
MHIYARQGDLVIDKLAAPISGDMERTRRIVFAGDSSGHPHTLLAPALMRRDGLRTFVRLSKAAEITHGKPDGHKPVKLVAGDYEIRPLRERGDGSDRAVED